MKKIKSKTMWAYLFSLPFLVAYSIFMVFPMGYSFYLSLFDWNGFTNKRFIGIENYIELFTNDVLFLKAIVNTLIITLFSLPVTLLIGLV
ncbi:MAG: sugar ABC transporter permease, partial [Eubacteriales bacterium]|nr:sugar ABC transporter permease [Eubacteriales bacterium]